MAILEAIDKNHPPGRHFYLSFIAVSPAYYGMGLGSQILKATLKQVDAAGLGAYAESSNPKNASFYERACFVAQKNIAPAGAPSLIPMWRAAETGEVLKLLENWRGASFADENQQTGFGEPGKGAPHGNENTCFAAHA